MMKRQQRRESFAPRRTHPSLIRFRVFIIHEDGRLRRSNGTALSNGAAKNPPRVRARRRHGNAAPSTRWRRAPPLLVWLQRAGRASVRQDQLALNHRSVPPTRRPGRSSGEHPQKVDAARVHLRPLPSGRVHPSAAVRTRAPAVNVFVFRARSR